MTREEKINLIGLIIIIGFASSVFYHYIMGVYMGMQYPYNTFLFRPWDKFMDFFNSYNHVVTRDPYQYNFQRAHLPVTQFMQYVFTFSTPTISFISFQLLMVVTFLFCNFKHLKEECRVNTVRNAFVFTFLAYPFLIEFDRAHIEFILFIFTYLFIYSYFKGKTYLSILFLSILIASKPYNLVYLVLFFSDKKYREIPYTLLSAIGLTFLSLSFFKGPMIANLNIMSANIAEVRRIYFIGNEGLYFSHSLYGLFKVMRFIYGGFFNVISDPQIYVFMAVALFLLVALYIHFIEKVYWKKVTLLTLMSLFLPYMGPDMRLIHLYVPLYLYINHVNRNKFDVVYCILFALLFIPKDYFHYFAENPEITSSIVWTPLIMLFLMLVIIIQGVNDKRLKKDAVLDSN